MGSIGEQEHHQPQIGKFEKTFPLHVKLLESWQGEDEQNTGGGKDDQRRADSMFQSPG
jgi:hypothetical protein